MSIKANLERLRERISRAAEKAKRDPSEVRLVAVTKAVGADLIREAIDCGIDTIGENRVHQAAEKRPLVDSPIEWHMIGHLQSRKARQAAELFDMVQSVESISTARALQKRCKDAGRSMPILIEVNTSFEEQKLGISPDETEAFAREIAAMPNLRIDGLMTMAAYASDPQSARSSFRMLRELAEQLEEKSIAGASFDALSMGMSGDFEVAGKNQRRSAGEDLSIREPPRANAAAGGISGPQGRHHRPSQANGFSAA
jgi:pyridoxal phosphate enzyme (YggS family)